MGVSCFYGLNGQQNRTPSFYLVCLKLFLFYTGRRRNECRKLTFDRVDLGRGVVVFDATTTKSKRTNVVPVCREAWDILREAAAERGESDRVFPSRTGGFAWDVSRTFQTVCRAAGIHGAKLHDLRRGWISKTLARGVGSFLVRDLVGHLHVQTPERYAVLNLGSLEEVVRGAV